MKKSAKEKSRRRSNAIGSRRPFVVIQSGAEKFSLLESVLQQSEFWIQLDALRLETALARKHVNVIVKPDLTVFDKDGSTATDPELVEHLIDLLQDRGFRRISVGVAGDISELWLENRDPVVLADMAGYRFSTSRGRDYEVIDLNQDLVRDGFAEGTTLYGEGMGRSWNGAHVRINFAKNKTDEQYGYALGLHNLLNIHPLAAKDRYYLHRVLPSDVVFDILRQAPPHFTIIDGFVSNHGNAGSRAQCPLETHSMIAGNNPVLTDWVGALKMGVDPHISSINSKALREIQVPPHSKIVGTLETYEGWINVDVRLRDSVLRRNQSAEVERIVRPWLQSLNRELFPFKNALDERLNTFFDRRFANVDQSYWPRLALTAVNYSLAASYESMRGALTLYAKDRLRKTERPLNINLTEYSDSDYDALVDYIEPLERAIRDLPVGQASLKWRYLDDSVLFEGSHVLPVPYSDFVSRVDISASVRLMNDYIGGSYVPVSRDKQGRITRQAERNIFLTQPNFLVLYGGEPIDVTKLEYCRYERTEQKIFWRTIKSDNASARFDDGCVTFTKLGANQTGISILSRQQFSLPLFWQAMNLGLYPEIKDTLVTQAYTTFFTHTLANFEAEYEGRDTGIGQNWPSIDDSGEAPANAEWKERLMDTIGKLEATVAQSLKDAIASNPLRKDQDRMRYSLDQEGFSHFAGKRGISADSSDVEIAASSENGELPGSSKQILAGLRAGTRRFFSELLTAVQQDFGSE